MIAWLTGCLFAERGGTAVGNPGDLDAKASRAADGLMVGAVTVPVAELALGGCGWQGVAVPVGRALDGVLPSPEPVVVPPGTWCGAELVLDGPLVVAGVTDAGTDFTVELLPLLATDGRFAVDGQRLLVEVPLLLEAEALDALGPGVVVPADDPLAVGWAAAAEASLWEDLDEDGLLSAADRVVSRPPSDTADLAFAAAGEAGCGCASRTVGSPWLLLAVATLARKRRTRRRSDDGGVGRGSRTARC